MSYAPGGKGKLSIADSGGVLHRFWKLITAGYVPGTSTVNTEEYLDEDPTSEVAKPPAGVFNASYRPHPGRTADILAEAAHEETSIVTLVRERGVAKQLAAGEDSVRELALAADGTLTPSGSSAPNLEEGSWTQGLGVVLAGVLYIIEYIASGGASAVVSRYGAIAQKKAGKDAAAIPAVAATHEWALVSLMVEDTYSGRLSVAGGSEADASGAVSASLSCQLAKRPTTKMVVP